MSSASHAGESLCKPYGAPLPPPCHSSRRPFHVSTAHQSKSPFHRVDVPHTDVWLLFQSSCLIVTHGCPQWCSQLAHASQCPSQTSAHVSTHVVSAPVHATGVTAHATGVTAPASCAHVRAAPAALGGGSRASRADAWRWEPLAAVTVGGLWRVRLSVSWERPPSITPRNTLRRAVVSLRPHRPGVSGFGPSCLLGHQQVIF